MQKLVGWWCLCGYCLLFTVMIRPASFAAELATPIDPDKWVLTGIASFSTKKLITLTELLPGGQRRSWTLYEGDRVGELEIREIDGQAGVVFVHLAGQKRKLRLPTFSSQPEVPNDEEQRRLEFVREHARFHAEQEARVTAGR